MSACCGKNKGHPDIVLSLLERMKVDQVPFNTVLLTTAINALARAGGNYTGFRNYFYLELTILNTYAKFVYIK